MPTYPDQPNADLLERIPLDAAVVLDVGCGAGSLGAAYRRLNPRARLLGIDMDPAAAKKPRGDWMKWRWSMSSTILCPSSSTVRSTASSMATCWNTCAIRGRCCVATSRR
jgi:trans-aconitate methyltransferase